MSTYTVLALSAHDLPKEYRPMVYAKWMRSLRNGNDYYKLIEPDAYYSAYQRYISDILAKPNAVIRLAVLTDDKDVVLGFSVSRSNVLDYVYVDKDQRRLGIGANLVPSGIDTITHLTKTGLSIWGSSYGSFRFNPFA